MRSIAIAALAVAGVLLAGTPAIADTPTDSYPTRCVLVTLPPNGTPLPEICILWPLPVQNVEVLAGPLRATA